MHCRGLLLSLIVLAGCALPGMPPPTPSVSSLSTAERAQARAEAAFMRARLYAEDEAYEAALAALQDAVAADPESAYLRVAVAELQLHLGNEPEALAAAEAALQKNPAAVDALLFLGNVAFSRDDYARAGDYYRRVLQLSPEIENARLHLAISLAKTGTVGEGIALLQQLLQQHPDNVYASLALGRIYRESGSLALAEETFQRLLAERPDLDVAQLELGLVYEAREDFPKALIAYRAASVAAPDNLSLHHRIARLLIRLGRLQEALDELEVVATSAPDDLDARRKIGLLNLELRRWDAAIAAFNAVLSVEPDLPQVRFYLGTAEEGNGQFETALATFTAIPHVSPLFPDALIRRVLLLQRLGRPGDAIALLEEEIGGDSSRPEFFILLAYFYQEAGRSEAVLPVFDRGMAAFPTNAELPYRMGLVLEQRGRREEALAAVRLAVQRDADHAEGLNFLAYTYAESGDHLAEALAMAQRAVALKPAGHIYDTLGWVCFRLKRYREARAALEQAVTLLGDDAVVHEHLGEVYRALGLRAKALASYRRALELAPENAALRDKLKGLERR